jgi:hypothetical protein
MHRQRRTYSKSFKAQVIQECAEPGASIANIALGYSLNANLVHKRIRLHALQATALQPAFIPLHSRGERDQASSGWNEELVVYRFGTGWAPGSGYPKFAGHREIQWPGAFCLAARYFGKTADVAK